MHISFIFSSFSNTFSIQLFSINLLWHFLLPASKENVAEDIPSSLNPPSHPIESEDELCSSHPVIPTSDDVFEEETPGESTGTETEDETIPQHKR